MSEGHPSLEETLLREARGYQASPRTRQRTLEALGLAMAPPATTSLLKTHALKLFLSAVLLSGVGYVALTHQKPNAAVAVVTHAPMLDPVETAVVANPISAPPVTLETASPTIVAPARHAPLSSSTSTAPPSGVDHAAPRTDVPSNLGEEIASIDRVRQAVYANDKEAALRGLDDYDRRFPSGTLAPEAQKLRARARALP